MRLVITVAAVALCVASLSVAAQTDPSRYAKKHLKDRDSLAKLTIADFQSTATVRDGDLDTVATIDTAKGFVSKVSAREILRTDNFLRAVIDKTSGRALYILYQSMQYQGLTNGFRDYNHVTYQSPAGIRSAALTSISRDVEGCNPQYGLCSYSEDFTLTLDEDLLRWISALPTGTLWRFKFTGNSDEYDWEDQLSPAEAAGLLATVAAYKAAHRLG